MNVNKVTRLEIIDNNGRSYTNWDVKGIRFDLQDDDRTLKIFVDGDPDKLPKIIPHMKCNKKEFMKLAKKIREMVKSEKS